MLAYRITGHFMPSLWDEGKGVRIV